MLSRVLREAGGAERFECPDVSAPVVQRPAQTAAPPRVEPHPDLERAVAAAREQGYCEGLAAGREQEKAAAAPLLQRLAAAIEEIGGMRGRLRREAEGDLVKLAIAIARRILARELAVDSGAVLGIAGAAVRKLDGQEIARVHAHPDIAAGLRAFAQWPGNRPPELIADASLQPGDLRFETARGVLDASVETQIAEIERGLADRLC